MFFKYLSNCMSLFISVTRFAWLHNKLLSLKKLIMNASAASCKHCIAAF